ncbi:MAG: hypothetical protein IT464_10580 [Planctomycetes bacterium]|nr:hypothetical protein [Planctomycetota bacterium]
MTRMLALAAAGAALLFVPGCKDQSDEIAGLQASVATQRRQLEDSEKQRHDENKRLQDEIDALRSQIGPVKLDGEKPVAERLADLEASAGKDNSAETQKKVAELEKKIDAARKETAAVQEELAKVAAGGGEIDENKVAELAAKKIAENAPTKDLKQAMDRLNISQAEKDMIRQEILDAKKGILETLEVPTADGRNMAEELIDTMLRVQAGKGENTDFMKLIGELSSQKIPGDAQGRSYWDAINDVKKRNRENISRILSPEDQAKLDKAHGDWSDFEVGEGDPWGPLYMERLEKYQAANK